MIKEVTQTNKNDIIEILKDIAGPLGPTRSIEDMEDLIKLRTDRYSTIDILVDIKLNPPDQKELGKIPFEDFEFELVEILTIIGVKDVIKFLKKAKELLYIEQARPLIIDVLGGIHHEVRIPEHPDGYSGGIRTLNRNYPDTLSIDLILQ